MRIVAGEFRGHPLRAPKNTATRPTTDRVREALMSTVASARGGFEGAAVLDAFAGSGALGLEALSRGAVRAEFCERDRAAARTVAENIAALGIPAARAHLSTTDVFRLCFARSIAPFDLVFLDPPYCVSPERACGLVARLLDQGAVAPGALVSYEYAKSSACALDAALEPLQWETVSNKAYGDTRVRVFAVKDRHAAADPGQKA